MEAIEAVNNQILTKRKKQEIPTAGEVIKILFDKCTNCNERPKEVGKKWCGRCIDRYRRKEKFSFEKMILFIPFEYVEAEIGDFPAIEKQLAEWNMQDNLFFNGNVGTGKTRAMYALYKKCCEAGYSAEVVEFNSVCSQIRDTYNGRSKETEDSIIKNLSLIDVLLIDDLGLQSNISDFSYLTFYRIINSRLAEGVATVISSNKSIESVADLFDKRISSRLKTFDVVNFAGEDFREKGSRI